MFLGDNIGDCLHGSALVEVHSGARADTDKALSDWEFVQSALEYQGSLCHHHLDRYIL
jgi:hypothetical protein